MLVSLRYRKLRGSLGVLAGLIMIIAYVLNLAFSNTGTEEQRANFAYNLGIVVLIAWAYSSGIAKYLMMIGHRKYKLLNVAAIILLLFLVVLGAQVPPSQSSIIELTFLGMFSKVLTSMWLVSWGILDICEIML